MLGGVFPAGVSAGVVGDVDVDVDAAEEGEDDHDHMELPLEP